MKDLTEKLRDLGFTQKEIEYLVHDLDYFTIYIPRKTRTVLQRHIPATALATIHPDKEVAIELCLVILSMLTSTIHSDKYVGGWKNLSSEVMNSNTMVSNKSVYTKIINLLKRGTKDKGPIIEVRKNEIGSETYSIKRKVAKSYRLTDAYKVGFEKYNLTTDFIVRRNQQRYNSNLIKATENTITMNCLKVQPLLTLPTKAEVIKEGRRLAKAGYKNSKGKKLTYKGTHVKEYWSDHTNRVFVEDHYEMFERLTGGGLMVPFAGGESSGGRVVDSLTLMPSWIRKMITINGQPIAESDYSTLHPNIVNKLYGMNTKSISHNDIVDFFWDDIRGDKVHDKYSDEQLYSIVRKDAKIEHLSFFNKEVVQMKASYLWDYYTSKHPIMLERVVADKRQSDYGYKITSRKLFKGEVELMTEVIDELNQQGIFVIYVYDAIYTQADMEDEVNRVMEEVAKRQSINTKVGNR